MPRSVDKIQNIICAVYTVLHLYGVALDCYATLPLEIHVVKHLCLHVLRSHCACIFEQSVGQSTFAVVDMSYDTEIAYIFHYGAKIRKIPVTCKQASVTDSLQIRRGLGITFRGCLTIELDGTSHILGHTASFLVALAEQ